MVYDFPRHEMNKNTNVGKRQSQWHVVKREGHSAHLRQSCVLFPLAVRGYGGLGGDLEVFFLHRS